MSFDLYVFDLDVMPDGAEAIGELLEDDARWGMPYTDRLAGFVAEMEALHPWSTDGEPGDSPWRTWPLQDSAVDGRCCSLNIDWSAAEVVSQEVALACQEHGLTLYDPQSGVVTRPKSAP